MPRKTIPFSPEELQRSVTACSENGEDILQLEQIEPGHVLVTYFGGSREHWLKLVDGYYEEFQVAVEPDDGFWPARNYAENLSPSQEDTDAYLKWWEGVKKLRGTDNAKELWWDWVHQNGLGYATDPDGE